MGCFDTVRLRCPHCNTVIPVQSKAGECALASYEALSVPIDVAGGVIGDDVTCDKCGIVQRIGGVAGNNVALSLFPIPR